MKASLNTTTNVIIWFSITLFYCYQYILRLLPNIIMPELMQQFALNATKFGEFAGVYYIGYVLMQIPFGLLLSRFGSKNVMPVSIFVTALGSLPIAISDSWGAVLLGRFLIGVGASSAIVGAFHIFRIIFPISFTRMLGTLVCAGLLTAVYISQPLSTMIYSAGIKEVIWILSIGGFVLSVVTYLALPKTPINQETKILSDILEVISNKKILTLSLLGGLMVAPLEGFADAWGTMFIRAVYGIERGDALAVVSNILTGMCLGSILIPYIAEKTKSYYGTTMTAGVVMASCFTIMLSGVGTTSTLHIINFIIGVCSAYQVIVISHASTYTRLPLSGIAAAVSNMIIMSFGYIFHKLIAYSIEYASATTTDNTDIVYSAGAYIAGIKVIPFAISIAVCGFVYLIVREHQLKRKNSVA